MQGRYPPTSPEQIAKMREMRRNRMNYKAIGDACECHFVTAWKYTKHIVPDVVVEVGDDVRLNPALMFGRQR